MIPAGIPHPALRNNRDTCDPPRAFRSGLQELGHRASFSQRAPNLAQQFPAIRMFLQKRSLACHKFQIVFLLVSR